MSYDALRKGRHSRPYQAYLVTTVTRNRRPWFNDIFAARLLIHELRQLEENGAVNSLAWVVMPDHLHWLLQLNENSCLPQLIKSLKARSALTINRYFQEKGSLWQRAYYDRAVRQEEDIRQIARYLVANPLRAGLVQNIGDYPHWDCTWMTDRDVGVLVE